jgi:glyoxylase-like metal-dependent hydrolase (beta-lactamase superfamily II)
MMNRAFALLTVTVLASTGLLGCSTRGAAPTPEAAGPAAGAVHMEHHVGTYVSSPRTFSTRSFVIEGATGLVLVDLQFTPSEAQRFVTEAERVTKKRTALGIVLHPNPDKFNGTETLQKRGVRVVTSAQVSALIPAVFRQRTAAFAPRYAPDWPTVTPSPEPFGDQTTELEAGGTRVRLHVLGAGCSEAHLAVEWDGDDGKHLFVGDLVANQVHSWLELGKTEEWLARIAELRALHPRFVHPGRGATGGPELLDQEERYLRDVLRLVSAERSSLPLPSISAEALDRVKAKLLGLYPRYDFDVFLDIGLPAVWSHQAR